MDGFKERLNRSLQFRLSVSLSLAILVVATIAAVFAFSSAFDEANELQDDVLRQVAALVDRQRVSASRSGDTGRTLESDEESHVVVQTIGDGGQPTAGINGEPPLNFPRTLRDGLQTLDIGGEPFRVLVRTLPSGERVAIAQETGVRDEIARDSALRTAMPLLILVPILLLVVADLVRKMFRPIVSLSADVDRRNEQDLRALEAGRVPDEVRPFVVAINRMLERVAQSVDTQRRFVANAAHELRSPLTAVSLQAERLAEADMTDVARERLASLRTGIERSRNLLEQLLALANAQAAPVRPAQAVSVHAVYRSVLEDLVPVAQAKQIDVGVEGAQDVRLPVDEFDLITLVKNLVDNAIRYTPQGGRVDLAVAADGPRAVLTVTDTGPGIALDERARVFDPFYRVLGSGQAGSGLGLSIVKAIAERIGAEVQLAFSDETRQSGLRVSVLIPLSANA